MGAGAARTTRGLLGNCIDEAQLLVLPRDQSLTFVQYRLRSLGIGVSVAQLRHELFEPTKNVILLSHFTHCVQGRCPGEQLGLMVQNLTIDSLCRLTGKAQEGIRDDEGSTRRDDTTSGMPCAEHAVGQVAKLMAQNDYGKIPVIHQLLLIGLARRGAATSHVETVGACCIGTFACVASMGWSSKTALTHPVVT